MVQDNKNTKSATLIIQQVCRLNNPQVGSFDDKVFKNKSDDMVLLGAQINLPWLFIEGGKRGTIQLTNQAEVPTTR